MDTIALIVALGLAGSIYKCEVDGQTVFSQSPCAEDAQELDEAKLSQGSGLGASDEDLERYREGQADLDIDVEIRRIRRESARRIAAYERERDACQRDIRRTANNLAGATWEVALRDCVNKYQELILKERSQADDRVTRLEDQQRQQDTRAIRPKN